MTDQTQSNANATEDRAATAEMKRVVTPKGHKLPQVAFADVRPLVQAMVTLNGPSSKNLIFDQANASATGGTASTKWAALGYYGFREDLGSGKFEASQRGRDLVSGDEEAERRAKQHALMATGARPLLKRFATRPVNQAVLAGILREDFGVPENKAMATASLLISLATEAGFIVDGIFKAGPIEAALDAVPEPAGGSANGKPQQTAARPAAPAPPVPHRTPAEQQPVVPHVQQPSPAGSPHTPVQTEGQSGPFGVSVEIRIDADKHSPEEIGKILREVRQALTTAD